MPWTKIINPSNIRDWELFQTWAKSPYNHGGRIKAKTYNGDNIVKINQNAMPGYLDIWCHKWPKDCLVIRTEDFYRPEFYKNDKDPTDKYGIGSYVVMRDLQEQENCRDWFIENIGKDWECLERVYVTEYRHCNNDKTFCMNIFEHVFIMFFKNRADMLRVKLTYDCLDTNENS